MVPPGHGSLAGSSTRVPLPVGHPPVNWETLGLAWRSSSAAHATAHSRSQRRRPIGPSRRDRSAAQAVAADEGLALPGVEERRASHMAATSRSGMPAMTRAPACERPALPWCSEAVASGDVMVDRVVPTGCGRISLVRLSSRR
jgi:hypothetical protein